MTALFIRYTQPLRTHGYWQTAITVSRSAMAYGMSRCFRMVWRLAIFSFLALSGQSYAASNDSSNIADYKIKAVYVYRFANFIYWPGQAPQTIRYCTLGNDRVTATLHELIAKEDAATKTVMPLSNINDASNDCQILYIAKNKLTHLSSVPQFPGTLTVSDSTKFLRLGGMIELRTLSNKVKPAISLDNVKKSGLTISSLLLRIALLPTADKGGNNE